MFNFIGSQAVDGAIQSIEGKLSALTPQAIGTWLKGLPVAAQILPLWGDMEAGYNAMTPEEKATFWKNLFIAGAALAAKAA